jgi:hypothetical protein
MLSNLILAQRFKFKIQKVLYVFRTLKKLHSEKVFWLSLGENCLTDNILQRYGIKSFSTPYSHGRSNIDYAILLEKSNYEGLLDSINLKYENVGNKKVVRSKIIDCCDNIFNELHMKGFEMTYQDVIQSKINRMSFNRKIKRLVNYRGKKKFVFFYHHRINENSNLDLIFKKSFEFSKFYATKEYPCEIIIFCQKIITNKSERKTTYKKVKTNIHFFEMYTQQIWSGNDENIFWAKIDDDLVKKMIDTTLRIINTGFEVKESIIQ